MPGKTICASAAIAAYVMAATAAILIEGPQMGLACVPGLNSRDAPWRGETAAPLGWAAVAMQPIHAKVEIMKTRNVNLPLEPGDHHLHGDAIAADAVIIGAEPVGLVRAFELGLLDVKGHVIDALPTLGGRCMERYRDKPIYDNPAAPVATGRQVKVMGTERFEASMPGMFAVGDIAVYPGMKKRIPSNFMRARWPLLAPRRTCSRKYMEVRSHQ